MSKLLSGSVLPCLVALVSGCGLIDVDMTSSPDTVRFGDPVTFDIKLTNRSLCPAKVASALLEPFIPVQAFTDLFNQVTESPDTPPDVIKFINDLRVFLDDLCSGGEPDTLPEPPDETTTTCARGADELVCTATRASAQAPGGVSLTFAPLGDRLRCELDAGTMRCVFRIPLPNTAAAQGSAALATQSLSCVPSADVGMGPGEFEGEQFCFIGTFPAIQGLGPGEMATGQVTLPARGSGFVRNIIVSLSDETEDLGVCKGGTNPGAACDRDDTDCQGGGSCAEGICVSGSNQGEGCDQATAEDDCGDEDVTCALCAAAGGSGFLPIDCTTTYIIPEPAPIVSPWALAGLAVVMCAGGMFWLRRRAA